jgi:hypothetical protein
MFKGYVGNKRRACLWATPHFDRNIFETVFEAGPQGAKAAVARRRSASKRMAKALGFKTGWAP